MSFELLTASLSTSSDPFITSSETDQSESLQSFAEEPTGTLKLPGHQKTITARHLQNCPDSKTQTTQTLGSKTLAKLPAFKLTSPMHLAATTYRSSSLNQMVPTKSATPTSTRPQPQTPLSKPSASLSTPPTQMRADPKHEPSPVRPTQTVSTPTQGTPAKKIETAQARHEKPALQKETKHSSIIQNYQFSKKETKQFWQARYDQKERQGDQQKERDQREHEPSEDEQETFCIKKTASVNTQPQPKQQECVQTSGSYKPTKPLLVAPKVGVFALYFILTKIGIVSDNVSNSSFKTEIEFVDEQTTKAHKERLEQVKEAIAQEEESSRWGIAVKVFSWLGSLMGIIAGIALIATGVGAVAGAMLVVGGAIQIANQIFELAGGWQKIAKLLPGDDPEKKSAIIAWMQIGISVLCLVLSGAGILWGGYSSFGKAMQTAMAVFGGVASIGHGVTTIGEGLSSSHYKEQISKVKRFDLILAKLKHSRHDLVEKIDLGVDRLEQLFEDLARGLEFEEELFQADQMLYR